MEMVLDYKLTLIYILIILPSCDLKYYDVDRITYSNNSDEIKEQRISSLNISRNIELNKQQQNQKVFKSTNRILDYTKKFYKTLRSKDETWEIYAFEENNTTLFSLELIGKKISTCQKLFTDYTEHRKKTFLSTIMHVSVINKIKFEKSLEYAKDLKKHDFLFIPLAHRKLYKGGCQVTINIAGFVPFDRYSQQINIAEDFRVVAMFKDKDILYTKLKSKSTSLILYLKNVQESYSSDSKILKTFKKYKGTPRALHQITKVVSATQYVSTSIFSPTILIPYIYKKYKKSCDEND